VSARDELATIVAAELAAPVPEGAHALTALLRERFGSNLRAVLFYGSCQRRAVDDEGILDLYALVDDYRRAFSNPLLVLANRWLPPNVFYLEAHAGNRTWRSKYAVLSVDHLARQTTARSFEPYFWARFAQPCTLTWVADDATRRGVVEALVNAMETFIAAGWPLMGQEFDSRELWLTTWRQTYRAELRSERPDVVEKLWNNAPQRYHRVTELLLSELPVRMAPPAAGRSPRFQRLGPTPYPRLVHGRWAVRIASSKVLFLLRILRNALIFEGGIDYILWKMARHSDVPIDQDWRAKPWPLTSLLGQLWRLYRAGAFR